MPLTPFDEPSQVDPVEGEVTLRGPGAAGLSMTPQAARETAARLATAAERAEEGHAERIDLDDPDSLTRWAQRLDVDIGTLRDTISAVGSDSEAVAQRLAAARGPTD